MRYLRCGRSIDTFFDKVMVMVEDETVRANRLALLQMLVQRILDHRRLQRDRDREGKKLVTTEAQCRQFNRRMTADLRRAAVVN